MQTVADIRGVGVKNRGKFADGLCGRPPMAIMIFSPVSNSSNHPLVNFLSQLGTYHYSYFHPGISC